MHSKNRLLSLKSKTTIFFGKIRKMCLCIMLLIILLNVKLFFYSYTTKVGIKDKKAYIIKLLIDIGKKIYTWK